MKTVVLDTAEAFEDAVDRWVAEAVAAGKSDFGALLTALPGVFPSVALGSVRRLGRSGRLPAGVAERAERYVAQGVRPEPEVAVAGERAPHPLDYEWRFARSAAYVLASLAREATLPGETVALLGCPSLYRAFRDPATARRRVVLLDANAPAATANTDEIGIYRCDLLWGAVPDEVSGVVIADPPWYPEHMACFLWAAARLCRAQGVVFLSAPPRGTRPGIAEDWRVLLERAAAFGLRLTDYRAGVLPYETPPFERNALRALGIRRVPQDWRRGDLATFVATGNRDVPRPLAPADEGWSESSVRGVRFRVRSAGDAPQLHALAARPRDPRLITLVPGDILPTVSRRDARRPLANVWTSGNRVFQCHSPELLSCMLTSATGQASFLDSLNAAGIPAPTGEEARLAAAAIRQVISIVEQERAEYVVTG